MLRNLVSHISEWRQIYVQVLLIATLTSAILGFVIVQKNINITKVENALYESEMTAFPELLAPIVESFDLASVDVIGDSLLARGYIDYVQILGPREYVLYESALPRSKLDRGYVNETLILPIFAHDDVNQASPIGTLKVVIRIRNLTFAFWQAINATALVFVILFAVASVTTVIYSFNYIAKPLGQLKHAVDLTLTRGQPVAAEAIHAGFIGTFQKQFNKMQAILLRSQVDIERKTQDLETQATLIREMLNSLKEAARLYTGADYADLGDETVPFPFPNHPLTTFEEFELWLKTAPGMAIFDRVEINEAENRSPAILFDVDICSTDRRWLNVKSFVLHSGCYALLVADMTQAKETEISLLHAQRMEVVGGLTSGIAHDFNNVLAIISGNLELINESEEGSEEVRQYADTALNASRRAASVVTSLLAFSKRKPENLVSVSAKHVLDEVKTIAKTSLGPSLELIADCTVPAFMKLDVASLESALINLIVNARDAMPHGGKIRLLARATNPDEIRRQNLPPDRSFVALSVIDQGTGIPPELCGKVLGSFFTTKKHGTGLGLAMVNNFATGAGGSMYFESNEYGGTTFSIILPCSFQDEPVSNAPAPKSAAKAVTIDHGIEVMLIEDELVLLKVMSKSLKIFGFKCVECTGLEEAYRHLENSPHLPDIVLTDLNLVDGSGLEILSSRFARLKTVPKVLLSGNMETGGDAVDVDGFDEICLKPVEGAVLRDTIHRLVALNKEKVFELS